MGLFEQIFRPRENITEQEALKVGTTFETLTAYRPRFTTWGGAIYESELVRAAIDANARHFSKLKVEIHGAAKPSLQAKLRLAPCEWMTWSQFLYRVSTILDVDTVCTIVPVYDEYMQTVGFFPVLPKRCSVMDYKGEPWLRYKFRDGNVGAAPMAECAVLTRFQYESDFFGDGNHALNDTMRLIHVQNEGIEEAVKSTATYRFMAQANNFTKADDLANERKRFTKANLSADADGDGGVLLFPNTYTNIKQIDSKPYTVDADQMRLIRENVENYFNVSEKVMQSAANGDELDAYWNGTIESRSIQFSEAMSKAIFSDRERAQGSYLIANANRLQYMTATAKVQMAKELADRGAILIDEIRELFNYPPLPDGAGQVAPIRGEYKPADELGQEETSEQE